MINVWLKHKAMIYHINPKFTISSVSDKIWKLEDSTTKQLPDTKCTNTRFENWSCFSNDFKKSTPQEVTARDRSTKTTVLQSTFVLLIDSRIAQQSARTKPRSIQSTGHSGPPTTGDGMQPMFGLGLWARNSCFTHSSVQPKDRRQLLQMTIQFFSVWWNSISVGCRPCFAPTLTYDSSVQWRTRYLCDYETRCNLTWRKCEQTKLKRFTLRKSLQSGESTMQ